MTKARLAVGASSTPLDTVPKERFHIAPYIDPSTMSSGALRGALDQKSTVVTIHFHPAK